MPPLPASLGYKIPQHVKVGYASGNVAKSMQWNSVDFLYLYFLTDMLGVDPIVSGLILLVSLVWDGVSDPLVGFLIDRYGHVFGTYSAILLRIAPLSALGFIGLFLLPGYMPGHVVIWAIVASLLFRLGYTLVDVPHNAMLANLSRDSRERSSLSAWRFLFSSLGAIILSLAVFPALQLKEGGTTGSFVLFSLAIGVIYVSTLYYSASSTRGFSLQRQTGTTPILVALRNLYRNKRLLRIFAVAAFTALLIPIFPRLGIYYAKAQLGDASHATYLIIANAIGQLIALPVWLHISHRSEKKTAAILSHLALIGVCLCFFALMPSSHITGVAFFAAVGFCFSGINTMNWAIVPDTVEYTEALTGKRHEAFSFGILLLLLKVFAGLSTALSGWALSLTGYSGEAAADTSTNGLVSFMAWSPILGATLCIIVLAGLNLSHKAHQDLSPR